MNNKETLIKYIRLLTEIIDLSINVCTNNEIEKNELRNKTIVVLFESILSNFQDKLSQNEIDIIKNQLETNRDSETMLYEVFDIISKNVGSKYLSEKFVYEIELLTKDFIKNTLSSISPEYQEEFDKEVKRLYLNEYSS